MNVWTPKIKLQIQDLLQKQIMRKMKGKDKGR